MTSQDYSNLKWNPKQPIIFLPEGIRGYYVQEANFLINDLQEHKLKIVLAEAPEPKFEGHKIRVVESRNPEWYSKLYHSYDYFRRDRSLRALERIASQQDGYYMNGPYKYDFIYRTLITERLIEGYSVEGCEVPPNEKVKRILEDILEKSFLDYFGLTNPP